MPERLARARGAKLGTVLLVFTIVASVGSAVWITLKTRTSPGSYMPRPKGTLTFNKDVAPIIFNYCGGCHRPKQSAPFSLLTYQEVKKRAQQITEVTQRRFMPPWLPEIGYGEFAEERRLSAEQIGLIEQWVAEGAREGVASDLPSMPKWTVGWQLGEPDLVVKMTQPYTLPPEGKEVYRNFVIPIPISAARHVKAVEFQPGNQKIVHHAFLKVDRTPQSRRLDEQDPEPGFNFMTTPDSAQIPEGYFLSWQPGRMASKSPEGLAWTLDKGTDLVLQLHMYPSGKPEMIESSVGFYFTDIAPTNSPFKVLLTSRALDIPAGQKNYTVKDEFVTPVDLDVLAILPHAHYLGKQMQGVATLPDGTKKWLLLINQWDFSWQSDYRYSKSVFLPKGTVISMHFTYDNSAENTRNPHHPPQRITYGPQTVDEMAELWLQVLPRKKADLTVLIRSFQEKMLKVFQEQSEQLLRIDSNNADAHNGLAKSKLGQGKDLEALNHFRAAAVIRPDFEEPHFYMGFILRKQRKLMEARAEYESVLRINSTNFEAHGNLGLIFLEQRNLDQAEVHFQSALRINSDDAIARKNLDAVLKARAAAKKPE